MRPMPRLNVRASDRLLVSTLSFLGLPYVIFFWGWLRPGYALIATLVLAVSGALAARRFPASPAPSPGGRGMLLRYCVVAAICAGWVLLSGAGGFGRQSSDYIIHNGRLLDLIQYRWPVVYPGFGALVYYTGYYLPCALLGKIAGVAVASRMMYVWALSGVLLAALWIMRLSGRRAWPVALFVLFAGLSVVGYSLQGWDNRLDSWEWWSVREVYLARHSMTFQLFWAPHQVIPAWLLTLVLYWMSVERREPGAAAFLVALGCLWTPFATLGLAPFLVAAGLSEPRQRWRRFLSFENVAGAGLLGLLFGVYYIGGSTAGNPHAWLWQRLPFGDWHILLRLVVFYALEFALLLALLLTRWTVLDRSRRLWFAATALVLLGSPLYVYGLWNDLHARGIVPSLVVLFLLVVEALAATPIRGVLRRPATVALVLVLAIGSLTPIPWLRASLREFGQTQPAQSVPEYRLGYQYVGSPTSPFFRYLARSLTGHGRHRHKERPFTVRRTGVRCTPIKGHRPS
jgi:hypothetical protein